MTEADFQTLKAQIEALERRLREMETRPQATSLWVEQTPRQANWVPPPTAAVA